MQIRIGDTSDCQYMELLLESFPGYAHKSGQIIHHSSSVGIFRENKIAAIFKVDLRMIRNKSISTSYKICCYYFFWSGKLLISAFQHPRLSSPIFPCLLLVFLFTCFFSCSYTFSQSCQPHHPCLHYYPVTPFSPVTPVTPVFPASCFLLSI